MNGLSIASIQFRCDGQQPSAPRPHANWRRRILGLTPGPDGSPHYDLTVESLVDFWNEASFGRVMYSPVQPVEIRARLAHELLMSLEVDASDEDAEAAWREVVDARAARVLSGDYVAQDWEQALAGIESRLE